MHHDAESHCPRCGVGYRAGFGTCADRGCRLEPGPPAAAGGEDGRLGPPDEEFERTLHALRADPGGFIALASMPVTDAVATANDLLKHGIEAAFVPFDDPNAPPVPEEVLRAGGVI